MIKKPIPYVLSTALGFLVTAVALGTTQIDDFIALPAADRAQWVGALGSVFALFVAAMIAVGSAAHAAKLANDQRKQEAERLSLREEEALMADRQSAVALVRMAAERIGGVARSLADGGDAARVAVAAGTGALENAQRNISAFPFWIIRDQHCVMQFSHVPGILELGISSCKVLQNIVQNSAVEDFPGPVEGVIQNLLLWENDVLGKANTITQTLNLPPYMPPAPQQRVAAQQTP